jgi:hypothetical protein
MQALTQTFNNNWSYEGEAPGRPDMLRMKLWTGTRHCSHMALRILSLFQSKDLQIQGVGNAFPTWHQERLAFF